MPLVAAAALSLILVPILRGPALRAGLVDRPGDLKIHANPIPVSGGIAVTLAVVVAWRPTAWVVAAIGLALVLGLVDDVHPLPPAARLAGQAICGSALVLGGLSLEPLGPLAGPGLVIAVIALANAVNMLDGQDGLVGGLGAVASIGLAVLLSLEGRPIAGPLALTGALVGFLWWNRPVARVFLGDGGAYAIAVALVALAADASADGWSWLLGAGCCLGVFAYELTATVVRRVRASATSTRGDRDHTYDRLSIRLGSRARSSAVMIAVGIVAAVIGVIVVRAPLPVGLALAAIAVVATGTLDVRLLPLDAQEETR